MKQDSLSAEAVLPCLLDRLCDDNPDDQRNRDGRQAFTMGKYRQCVLRDLGWLLNAASHPEDDAIHDFPEVDASVLNFGMPDLCGRTVSSWSHNELENKIRECILRFEPRILPESLEVKMLPSNSKASPNLVGFEIRALLWGNPMPERFLLKTQIDLDTGQCEF